MIVDAHQHFWAIADGDLPWLADQPQTLRRDRLPDDLRPLIRSAGVSATVLVQAASSADETKRMLDIASATDFVAGVVGWIDPLAMDFETQIATAEATPLLRGFRIDAASFGGRFDDAEHDSFFEALRSARLTVDVLAKPSDLVGIGLRLDRTEGLRLVIDHATSPDEPDDAWLAALGSAAAAGAWCKASGMVNTPWYHVDRSRCADVINSVLEIFGARLMWGSDWPILDLGLSYPGWLAICRSAVERWPEVRQAQFFGGAAIEFYALDFTSR